MNAPDPNINWESDKNANKHNTQGSQDVSLFPADDYKAVRNRQYSITKIKMKHEY